MRSETRTARTRRTMAVGLVVALVAAGCGKDAKDSTDTTSAPDTTVAGGETTVAGETTVPDTTPAQPGNDLAITTPAGTQEVDSVTWAIYREVGSLDPIYAFDYPENTVLATMCETLLTQQPDGSLADGLATLEQPDPTTMVFTLKDGVTFWDGNPVTADDVVFSLTRASDPALGGFYAQVFTRVTGIEATADNEVTITLSEPDYWLLGELASTGAWIVEKATTEAAGAAFGSPDAGIMCSGAYQLGDWNVGERLSVERNDNYWNTSVKPLVARIDFVPVPDATTLTAGLLSGDIDGTYGYGPIPTIEQLQGDSSITVTKGAGWNVEAFIVSNIEGVLATKEARQALSMALDRQAYIDAIYHGLADIPHSLSGPGTWGYGTDVFAAAYAELPALDQDLEAAKALAEEAGVAGQTLTIGYPTDIEAAQAEANMFKTAAEELGIKVELNGVTADQYINFFIDPAFREGVDGFFTVNYGDYADPAALLATLALPEGSQNFSGYSNQEVADLLNEARSTEDLDARAEKVAAAQALIMEDMAWIPVALPPVTVLTRSNLSGEVASFAYMFAPWALQLGGV